MNPDLATLEIRVLYDSIGRAENRLEQLERQGRRAERGVRDLGRTSEGSLKSLLKLGSGAAAVTATVGALRAIVSTTRDYQVMRAALEQSTGSMEKMEAKWKDLVAFASATPYSLEQAVNGFNKLTNLGLDPSERAMTSFGETAAAMGKQLNDMIEAVADASTGEFERLKEFGIKAKTEGDKVTFTFKGISTTVAKESDAITEYLTKLGETNFAGSMAKRMETLDGAISNLSDTWDQLLFALGQSGIGDAAEDAIRGVTAALADLQAFVESGAMNQALEVWGIAWEDWGTETQETIDMVANGLGALVKLASDLLDEHSDIVEEDGNRPWLGVYQTIQTIPAAVMAYTKIAAAELRAFAVEVEGIFKQVNNEIEATAGRFTVWAAQNTKDSKFQGPGLPGRNGSSLWSETDKSAAEGGNAPHLPESAFKGGVFEDGSGAFGVLPALEETNNQRADQIRTEAADALKDALEYADQVSRQSADEYNLKVDEIIQGNLGVDEKLDAYNKRKTAQDNAPEDPSKPKRPKPSTGSSGGGGGGKSGGQSEFDKLVEDLRGEEAAIAESYAKRLEIIRANTEEGSVLRLQLETALTEELQKEQLKRVEELKKEPETYREAMTAELEIIRAGYEERRRIILESTALTEEMKAALLEKANDQYKKQVRKHWEEDLKAQTGAAKNLFGNLEALGQAFGERGFMLAKAAAMANAAISGPETVMEAYKQGMKISVYAAPVFAAVAAAAVGAQIGQIAAAEYKGAFATGGYIPAGTYGVVGEAGPEIVNGPAMVTSAQNTRDRYGRGAGGSTPGLTLIVENYGNGEVTTTQIDETTYKLIVSDAVREARTAVAKDIETGGTAIDRQIREKYKVKR